MVTLRLGRLEVDWGKNSFFRNYSPLFDRADFAEAEYFYAYDEVIVQPAYVRKFRRVIPRLELLGFSLDGCRTIYAEELRRVPDYYPEVNISFDVFRQALCAIDVDRVCNNEYDGDFDLGEFAAHVLSDPEFKRVLASYSCAATRMMAPSSRISILTLFSDCLRKIPPIWTAIWFGAFMTSSRADISKTVRCSSLSPMKANS